MEKDNYLALLSCQYIFYLAIKIRLTIYLPPIYRNTWGYFIVSKNAVLIRDFNSVFWRETVLYILNIETFRTDIQNLFRIQNSSCYEFCPFLETPELLFDSCIENLYPK